MKKKILFGIVGVALFAVALAFNVQQQEKSDLMLKNVEALAEKVPHNECGCYVCSPSNSNNACRLDCKWWMGWIC